MQILGREFTGAMNFSVVLVICQVHSSVEDKETFVIQCLLGEWKLYVLSM